MQRWVAFVRAINVGASNRITMVRLAEIFAGVGCVDVSWYLQTGNVFFSTNASLDREALAVSLEAALTEAGLKKTDVILRTADELAALLAQQPFAALDADAHRFSTAFLRRPPTKPATTDRITSKGGIVCLADDAVLCVALPKTIDFAGASWLSVDKPWGTATTTRWWHVVEEIAARVVD